MELRPKFNVLWRCERWVQCPWSANCFLNIESLLTSRKDNLTVKGDKHAIKIVKSEILFLTVLPEKSKLGRYYKGVLWEPNYLFLLVSEISQYFSEGK